MGRPRKATDLVATTKIENAFWYLLETEDYSRITVQKLADAAEVNRNAVYYHYENIDDVAKKAFINFLHTDTVEQFVNLLFNGMRNEQKSEVGAEFVQGVRKLQLCSGSNSIYLNQLLKTAIRDNMFRIMNIDETKLDEIEKISVEFTLSGIVALLGSKEVMVNPLLMLKMPETDIGKAALGELRRLSEEIKGR